MGTLKTRGTMATVGSDFAPVAKILTEIFDIMDDNGDKKIDEDEGVAIGMAMGETAEQARKSWGQMCKDMDEDANTTIELPEWLAFYEKSLKDAKAEDVISMLTDMKGKIEAEKAKK